MDRNSTLLLILSSLTFGLVLINNIRAQAFTPEQRESENPQAGVSNIRIL